MIIALNDSTPSIPVQVVTDAGLPVTGLNASAFPQVFFALAGTNIIDSLSLEDIALDAAWLEGGLAEYGQGRYRLDLPNSLPATAGAWSVWGEAPDKRLLAPLLEVTGDTARLLDLWNAANAGEIALTGPPIATDGTLTIYRGADYYITDSRSLNFTVPNSVVDLSVSGTTAYLEIRRPGAGRTTFLSIEKADFLTAGASSQTMRFQLSRDASSGSASFPPGTSIYRVIVRKAGLRDIPTHTGAAVIVERPDPSPFGG